MSDATDEQPPPTEGSGEYVWPSVIERHDLAGGELWDDMLARDALGRERYGTPLRVWNGRDATADAYQEALDLLVYLEQVRLRLANDRETRATFDLAQNHVLGIAVMLRRLHAEALVPIEEPTPGRS